MFFAGPITGAFVRLKVPSDRLVGSRSPEVLTWPNRDVNFDETISKEVLHDMSQNR